MITKEETPDTYINNIDMIWPSCFFLLTLICVHYWEYDCLSCYTNVVIIIIESDRYNRSTQHFGLLIHNQNGSAINRYQPFSQILRNPPIIAWPPTEIDPRYPRLDLSTDVWIQNSGSLKDKKKTIKFLFFQVPFMALKNGHIDKMFHL